MSQKINLEIISPERLLLNQEVDFVVLPAEKGECGILPGHAPFLVQLGIGELRIVKEQETEYFAVSGGFAEVHPYKISVFAETAEMAKEIDIERARLAAEKAKIELSTATSPQNMALLEAALKKALLRLRISEFLSRKRDVHH